MTPPSKYEIMFLPGHNVFSINMIYEIQWTNETHFFIKIYLSFYSRKGPQFVVRWERDGDTYTRIGDFFLSHTSSRNQGVPTLAPTCKLRRLWSAACPLLDSRFTALCLNLPALFSSCGLLPVTNLLDPTAMTRCHPPLY